MRSSPYLLAVLFGLGPLVVAVQAAPAGGPMLAAAFEGPMSDVEEIVFAVRAPGRDGHWYANFGYWASNEQQMMYGENGGRLCRPEPADRRARGSSSTIPRAASAIRTCITTAQKILFSYRRGERSTTTCTRSTSTARGCGN